MSATRRRFTPEYKIEAAHRVIDSGRGIAEVARELGLNEMTLGNWVREERRRIEAAKGTDAAPLSMAERAEVVRPDKYSSTSGSPGLGMPPPTELVGIETGTDMPGLLKERPSATYSQPLTTGSDHPHINALLEDLFKGADIDGKPTN